jgi:hypothetical protein
MLNLKSLQNQPESVPNITGLIMIDCWPHGEFDPHLEPFYHNMLPVLDQFDFQIAVSACYAQDMYSTGPLSPLLREYLRAKCEIIDVTDDRVFFERNQSWQITNWLVVGLSWQWCLHTRPMGLNNLLKGKTQEEFFIHPTAVLTRDLNTLTLTEVRNDQLLWQTVSGLGYRLVK